MTFLIIFILGMVFCNFILPSISFAIEMIEARLNVYLTDCGVKVSSNQAKIKKEHDSLEESSVAAIGFHYEEPDSEFDNFPEEDKCHGRIGF